MKILSTALVLGAFVAVVNAPTLATDTSRALDALVSPDTAEEAHPYDTLCPLLTLWVHADRTGRTTLANQIHNELDTTTNDHRAFYHAAATVVTTPNPAHTAAYGYITRQCDAHGN